MTQDARTRLLKLGVTVGSEFLYRAYFVAPSMVTVGTSEKATLRIQDEAVPEDHELFSIQPDSCLLQFKRDMNLAFLYDGLFRRPNFLIDEGLAFRRGRNYVLNLETRARGTLNFGATRILFKLEVTDRPSLRRIPVPEFDGQPVRCAACGEQLQNVLAVPGAVTRCDFCKSLNRFEGLTGEVATTELPAEPDPAVTEEPSVEEPSVDGSPLLLTSPISAPEAAATTSMEERNTVLDAGVIHQDPGGPSKVHLPAPMLPGENGDIEPPSPGQISEKDTLVTSSTGLKTSNPDLSATSAPTALPPAISEPVEPISQPLPPPVSSTAATPQPTQQMSSGDALQTLSDPGVTPARAEPNWQPPAPVSSDPPAQPGLHSGGVAPIRVQRRRHRAAFSSAPHATVQEPPRESGRVSGNYAAGKLADRLTLLIVTLALIALLLAAILGALLMQGAMRRWTAPAAPPTGEVELEDDAGALDA